MRLPPQAGGLPGHWPHVTLALGQGFNLTAFALSLLLVFRTNSSYDRWWEARKLWGGVVNRTRDFVRQVGPGGRTHASGARPG
jgi:predicted membrane chloride channel (bestrophin family)